MKNLLNKEKSRKYAVICGIAIAFLVFFLCFSRCQRPKNYSIQDETKSRNPITNMLDGLNKNFEKEKSKSNSKTKSDSIEEEYEKYIKEQGTEETTYTTSPNTVTYKVKRVVDGDTFIIIDNNKQVRIRLIGIDTPESVNPDNSKNCPYGKTASLYTTNLIQGKEISLEYDEKKTDDYGRTLAYAYIDGEMINYKIVENGYAVAKEYPPNTKYAKIFKSAQITAEKNKKGMWADNITDKDCNIKSQYYISY